ncbi:MAG TPA: hypothetical protein VLV15_05165 [Dongiaceae bacterium]|nr:hypothetical protein [Dongiaceae bacterium]
MPRILVTPAGGTLVIAPHADDEVLGCASVLEADTLVLYLGIDDFHVVDRATWLEEIAAAGRFFGFAWRAAEFPVNRYYAEHRALVQQLERSGAIACTPPRCARTAPRVSSAAWRPIAGRRACWTRPRPSTSSDGWNRSTRPRRERRREPATGAH